MRKGVIRPRSFGAPPSKRDDEDDNGKGLRGLQARRSVFAMLLLATVLALMYVGLAHSPERKAVSVSLSVDLAVEGDEAAGELGGGGGGGGGSARLRAFDGADADVEDDEDGLDGDEEEDEDGGRGGEESGGGGGGGGGGGHVEGEHLEEDLGVNVEGDGSAADDGGLGLSPDTDDVFAGLEVLDSGSGVGSGLAPASSGGSSHRRGRKRGGGTTIPRMSIEAYFVNLGKRTVNISPSGSFKFVLLHAKDMHEDGAYIVQGCSYKSKTCKHPDAARYVSKHLEAHGIESRVMGGGRITRHRLRKSKKSGLISVFGHSRSYGKCDDCNKKTCAFIAQAYPDYVVRWSNQGYSESDESLIKDWEKCSEEDN